MVTITLKDFTATLNLQDTTQAKAIKKARYNINKLAGYCVDLQRGYNPTPNGTYTLTELKQIITGEGVTILGQVLALEHIEKLEKILV